MKIQNYHLEVFDSMNYVVYTKKRVGKDSIERIVDPSYFSRPNIIPVLTHIKNMQIDAKLDTTDFNELLEVITQENKLFIQQLKTLDLPK
jgi:hypothetical protein